MILLLEFTILNVYIFLDVVLVANEFIEEYKRGNEEMIWEKMKNVDLVRFELYEFFGNY